MNTDLPLWPGLELCAAEYVLRFAEAHRNTISYELLRAVVIARFPWAEQSPLISMFILDVMMGTTVASRQH